MITIILFEIKTQTFNLINKLREVGYVLLSLETDLLLLLGTMHATGFVQNLNLS